MYLTVEVRPGVRREKIERRGDGYVISVREPAQRNLANRRTQEIVAELCKVPVAAVTLVSGHRSPKKLFSIDNT